MKFNLIMENWRTFVKEQAEQDSEKHPGGYISIADEEGKEIEGGVSVDSKLEKQLEKEFNKLEKNKLPMELRRPYKHSIIFGTGYMNSKEGLIINAEHMKENPKKWILGKNSDNAKSYNPNPESYSDTHWGCTELITMVRAAIDHVHSIDDETYNARLVKMFLGETDTKITQRHKNLIPMFQELGWIPQNTGPLYIEDFSVRPWFTDAYGNTYHGHHGHGKGKITGHGSHQNGMDADLGFYMLPGYEMKTRFTRNNTKNSGREIRQFHYDYKTKKFRLKEPKNFKHVEYGAMPPKNTWHRAVGGKKHARFDIKRDIDRNYLEPEGGPIKSVFDTRLMTREGAANAAALDILDAEEFNNPEAIVDILLRDYNQRTYHGSKNQSVSPEVESEPSFDEKLSRKAEFIKMYLGSEYTGRFDRRIKGEGGASSAIPMRIIRRPIGSLDTERTWQLIKGLRDNGAVLLLIDDQLIPALKDAAARAGDPFNIQMGKSRFKTPSATHWQNHRNHIHVRVNASRSKAIGRKIDKKLRNIILNNHSIIQKIKDISKENPKILEKYYEKYFKEQGIAAWKWSQDTVEAMKSLGDSIVKSAAEAFAEMTTIFNVGEYLKKFGERGPGPWRDEIENEENKTDN